jgi:hypothetical protein
MAPFGILEFIPEHSNIWWCLSQETPPQFNYLGFPCRNKIKQWDGWLTVSAAVLPLHTSSQVLVAYVAPTLRCHSTLTARPYKTFKQESIKKEGAAPKQSQRHDSARNRTQMQGKAQNTLELHRVNKRVRSFCG